MGVPVAKELSALDVREVISAGRDVLALRQARTLAATGDHQPFYVPFYVAITRARNELYLSYPLIRAMRSNGGDVMQQPSRFLGEIPKDLIDEWNMRPFNPYG